MKNNLSLFLFIALFIFSCTDKSNNESTFFDKNTYRNSGKLRTDNQQTIDWLTNKVYGFSELIEYNNRGEYGRYAFIKLKTKFVLCVHNNRCMYLDTIQFNGYEIIDEGILNKGIGKIELYTIKSDTTNEFLFKNKKNVGLNVSSKRVYNYLPIDSILVYEADEIISDIQIEKAKDYIKKKDLESLSTFFVDCPIFVLKFIKKGEEIDESKFYDFLTKCQRIARSSMVLDTSKLFQEEYYNYMENKYRRRN